MTRTRQKVLAVFTHSFDSLGRTGDEMNGLDDESSMTGQETEPSGREGHRMHNPHYYARLHARLHRNRVVGLATKMVVTTVGVLVILAGLVMMVAPGPGLLAIVVGLGILATEWAWADRWVQRAKAKAHHVAERARHLDPAVRRRRIALGVSVILVVAVVVTVYLVVYDWPAFAVSGWRTTQGLVPFLPDLPGM